MNRLVQALSHPLTNDEWAGLAPFLPPLASGPEGEVESWRTILSLALRSEASGLDWQEMLPGEDPQYIAEAHRRLRYAQSAGEFDRLRRALPGLRLAALRRCMLYAALGPGSVWWHVLMVRWLRIGWTPTGLVDPRRPVSFAATVFLSPPLLVLMVAAVVAGQLYLGMFDVPQPPEGLSWRVRLAGVALPLAVAAGTAGLAFLAARIGRSRT